MQSWGRDQRDTNSHIKTSLELFSKSFFLAFSKRWLKVPFKGFWRQKTTRKRFAQQYALLLDKEIIEFLSSSISLYYPI